MHRVKSALAGIARHGPLSIACTPLFLACGTTWAEYTWPDLEEIEPITDIREVPRDTREPFAAAVGDPVQKLWTRNDYASIHTYAYRDAERKRKPVPGGD
jgi:hypothetical protein